MTGMAALTPITGRAAPLARQTSARWPAAAMTSRLRRRRGHDDSPSVLRGQP